MYGDTVRGEHRGPETPVSVALVFDSLGAPEDAAVATCLREGFRAHRFEPWIVLREELARIGDVFPVKLFEVERYGSHLCGPMNDLGVEHDTRALRLRVEQLSRNALMRRRRAEFVQQRQVPARGNAQWASQLRVLLAAFDFLLGGRSDEGLEGRVASALGCTAPQITEALSGEPSEATDLVLCELIRAADALEEPGQ